MPNPHFLVTSLILAMALGVIVRMIVIEKRPRTNLNPSLIPTTPVMIICGFIALLALVHLINLAGIHTGR